MGFVARDGLMVEGTIEALSRRHEDEMARARRRTQQRERRAWARGVLDGVLSQIRSGDVAVDCGANVGEVSAPLAEAGATVYAFEPDPVAFAELTLRLAPFENAHPVNAAVGLRDGRATLRRSVHFEGDPLAATVGSTLMDGKRDRDQSGSNDIEVDVVGLPDLLQEIAEGRVPRRLPKRPGVRRRPGRLAVLKIDVEGGELELLPALHEAALLGRIGCTLVETHQRKFPDRRRDFLRMRREIGALYPSRKVNLDWI